MIAADACEGPATRDEPVVEFRGIDFVFPLVGINWWPLFNTIQWDYREKTDKPLVDFIYPGGWNNGLYVINAERDGDLVRVHTPAATAYKGVIHRDQEEWKRSS